jgi:hypothetical protein
MTNIAGDVTRVRGFATGATKFLESIGLLNKGSSGSPATPSPDTNAGTVGIGTNTLNVTRVGGTASLTVAVGTAALTLFHLDTHTAPAARAAAYAAVGLMVSAALIATAVILQADVRSRSAIEIGAQARSVEIAHSNATLRANWSEIVNDLEHSTILVLQGGINSTFEAARLARETISTSRQFVPPSALSMKHSELMALQGLATAQFVEMANAWPDGEIPSAEVRKLEPVIDSMRNLSKSLR